MASNQYGIPAYLGFVPGVPAASPSTLQLNGAATWLAMGFNVDSAKTLARVRLFATAVAGTLGNTDVSCDVYSDGSGSPNASLATSSTLTSPPVAASAWNEWGGAGSGFNLALNANTQYWAVFKNNNGTPGTNFPTFQFGSNLGLPFPARTAGNVVGLLWAKKHSTNSGTSWGTGLAGSFGLRLEYTDGSFDGFPFQNSAAAGSAISVNGTSELGTNFTLPANAKLNVRGLAVMITSVTNVPTNPPRLGLWTGGPGSESNLGYATCPLTVGAIASSNACWLPGYFASNQVLTGGTVYTVTLGTTGADPNTKRYNCTVYTNDGTAAGEGLMPFEGTAQQAYYNGTSWAYTASALVPFALILDTGGEFAGQPVGQQCL